jgi:peptide/histidine transporter 3/4
MPLPQVLFNLPNVGLAVLVIGDARFRYVINCIILCIAAIFGVILLTYISCKRYINVEPPPRVNPVKLIYKVTLYALRHKVPSFRSAFTYGEGPPGRFDLAKERYGGPFTTEQVEDVKSFGNIIMVLIPFCGCFLPFLSVNQIIAFVNINLTNISTDNYTCTEADNYTIEFFQKLSLIYQGLLASITILIFQLIIFPYFHLKMPNQLKRLRIAVSFSLLSSATQLILSILFCSFFSIPLLFIPLTINGIGIALSYTTFEFIIAQSPHSMQGFLLGIFPSFFLVIGLVTFTIHYDIPLKYVWIIYSIILVITLISSIIFCILAFKCYTPRRRNETSTVNERIIIEEYWERNLTTSQNSNEKLELNIQSIR